MRRHLGVLVCAALAMNGCEMTPDDEPSAAGTRAGDPNPLLMSWDTPFGVPPFDRIEDDHYLPALREGMARHKAEVEEIAASSALPTFENTVEALERSGRLLTRVGSVFSAVNSAHSNDAIREAARVIAPERSAHSDDITMNRPLFERIEAVYEQRDSLDLLPEQRRLLEETHKTFVRSGANLDPGAQAELREINGELAGLAEEFDQNLLKETNDFELLVTDRAALGALPETLVAGAAAEAKRRGHDCECWVFTLQRPSINPFLEYSPDRELRKQLFLGYAMRGDNGNEADNRDILARMVLLRAERAQLLGFETHAHYVLADTMAEVPERVYELLDKVWAPALEAAKRERQALQEMMAKDGIDGPLEGWDWRHYTEKVRKARFDLDEEALRPYFEFTAVRDGAFQVAGKLWGITFEAREDLPRWHPDQQVFEVHDADESLLGILYMDFFARESKQGGAWMNALRSQSRLDGEVLPIITNNFNFPAPTAGTPSLLSRTEASTLFHEFGHALHGLFSDVTYESFSGTRTPRDFVEFPSQVMENWMSEPAVLRLFAKHYETGEPIPQELIDKIEATAKFNQGFETLEYMAASYLDMAYHTMSEPDDVEPRAFEEATMSDLGLIEEILPRYRSGYFSHIFGGNYSAGYYSYLWAEVLDADAFEAFKEAGLFDQATAQRFRDEILSRGGTQPGMELFEAFRGRQPSIDALLERRGLADI